MTDVNTQPISMLLRKQGLESVEDIRTWGCFLFDIISRQAVHPDFRESKRFEYESWTEETFACREDIRMKLFALSEASWTII